MSLKKSIFRKGIVLKGDTAALDGIDGEIKFDSADKKFKVTANAISRELVDNSTSQSLSNKTLTSPVINTGVSGTAIDTDVALTANSDTLLASQKATKAYADSVASTASSDLNNHITDAIDAHDASAISVVPTGNLASTEVQAALVELQGEADTANTHIATSMGVHGVTGSVVGTQGVQTLEDKILTNASIRTPSRLDVKQDTRANLDTYALTAANGQLVFATDEKAMFQVVDTELVPVGGAGVVKITAGENLTANDIVYISLGTGNDSARTAGLVYKGDATVDERVDVIGIATKTTTSGNIAEIQVSGLLKGFTSRTAGALYYLSAVTPGAASTTPPSSNTQWIVPVYQGVSATEVNINPVAAASAIFITDSETSFTIANNQAAAADITGLVIDPVIYRGVNIEYSLYRQTDTASSARAEFGQIRAVYNTQSTTWFLSNDFAGQNAGVTFSITTSGQLQYASTDIAGANYVGTMKYFIKTQFGV